MTSSHSPARAQFSMGRTYAASIDEAWALWTTSAGIESGGARKASTSSSPPST